MTKLETAKKRKWFLFTIIYFIIGYMGLGNLNMFRSHYFNVELPFEANIPFIPAFILGYTSVYFALILVYALIDDYKLFDRAIKFFLTVSTAHFILFLLVPVKMTRPDLADAAGTMNLLTKYYYLIDNPTNCFPSLHVAYPLAGTIALWNYKRGWAVVLLFATLLIAVSVLLVKQHYFMDVFAAGILTPILWWITTPGSFPRYLAGIQRILRVPRLRPRG